MVVVVDKVVKRFGEVFAIRDLSLRVQDGELFFLLGPSGCGKSTLLRLLAGFYEPDSGRIVFGDRVMNGVPAEKRNTGMVFQGYALFPHLSVQENVAYGLETRGIAREERSARVAEALELVRLGDLAKRSPNQLSGGQQQRVALARALVIKPDLLLLDEPLSNLDARLRVEMRDEIRRIHSRTGITTVYVTHDQSEALCMASNMAVMRRGEAIQVGTAREVYGSPKSRFVADFLGGVNWLEGKVIGLEGSSMVVESHLGAGIKRWTCSAREGFQAGDRVHLGFRAEYARRVFEGEKEVQNDFWAEVEDVLYLGSHQELLVRTEGGNQWRILEFAPGENDPQPGEGIKIGAKMRFSVRSFLVFRAE